MDYLHWIFLALYMTLAVAAMVTILLDNRQPAKTMAWVLVLMFLPVVGIILYFFFGQNVRKERTISQHSLDQLSRRSMLESHAQASLKIPPLYQRLVHLFDSQDFAPAFHRNDTEIYLNGYEFFPQLLRDIASARDHIHLDFFLFEDDPLGRLVSDALIAKASEGVECMDNTGKTIDALLEERQYKAIVSSLLEAAGLNYGALPKGLLKFHRYADGVRTPLEEHLVEGALYAAGKSGEANVHFTVSTEHRQLFQQLVDAKVAEYEAKYGIRYHVSFSEQKPSTDTVAADMENKPFRDKGKLLFRPGGHGALIENLNDLDADVVFIKNIDNVVPDRLKGDTVTYKKLLAGVLVTLQAKAFDYLRLLDGGHYSHDQLEEIIRFVQRDLRCRRADLKQLEDADLVIYLRKKLNRPMRVCGMVKNVGEPGGGPFLAYNPDGTVSLQILESSQIDMKDPEKKAMFEQGTHFNPVDLVCAVRDYKGNKFNLLNYVDKATGFISYKSKGGKELKALELPGLWNGSMSDWNTVFVEVPLSTFNPVKTVNDLLREQHQ